MFQLLGRLAVVDGGGRAINVRAAKQQAILAVLMLRPGGVVSVDRLMTELWPDEPPATARASLQTYVYRLRRTLAPLAAHGVDLTTLGTATPWSSRIERWTSGRSSSASPGDLRL